MRIEEKMLILPALYIIKRKEKATTSDLISELVYVFNEYSCAMKSHFQKIGNQMSGSGNHLCEFTRVMFYLDRIPLASICHVQHQCL